MILALGLDGFNHLFNHACVQQKRSSKESIIDAASLLQKIKSDKTMVAADSHATRIQKLEERNDELIAENAKLKSLLYAGKCSYTYCFADW